MYKKDDERLQAFVGSKLTENHQRTDDLITALSYSQAENSETCDRRSEDPYDYMEGVDIAIPRNGYSES
ncbi:hypothetical protein [Cytobacillus purgationiresistens]|uniref:Uncharacterized protein n=1 Tax=Cytobacillus purgationiresistens TaxID=863449 RepID=A0ABU0AED2_9BACI|nr:hypothetical protein [Cytobacillus purgationiresistens]MDQ0268445.1 hypothetical protein [Cytobacillus purgationiresistens]